MSGSGHHRPPTSGGNNNNMAALMAMMSQGNHRSQDGGVESDLDQAALVAAMAQAVQADPPAAAPDPATGQGPIAADGSSGDTTG